MLVIGILGGVASGKSLVSQQLVALGARLLDADRAGHEVLFEDKVKQAIRERWGDAVFNEDGEVNRTAVANIVFGSAPNGPRELTFLEQLTHPRIREKLNAIIATERAAGATPAMVLDAPVMLKSGWDTICDCVLFVDANRENRLERAQARGWSEADFDAREAAQVSLETKRQRADATIHNDGTIEETREQVEQFWLSLGLGLHQAPTS